MAVQRPSASQQIHAQERNGTYEEIDNVLPDVSTWQVRFVYTSDECVGVYRSLIFAMLIQRL
jgi:hypothetical protein